MASFHFNCLFSIGPKKAIDRSRRPDTGKSADTVDHLTEISDLLGACSSDVEIDTHNQQLLRQETRVYTLQAHKASHEQARPGQQSQRDGELADYKSVTDASVRDGRPFAAPGRCIGISQRWPET